MCSLSEERCDLTRRVPAVMSRQGDRKKEEEKMISTSLRLPRIKLKEQLFLTAIANARDRGSLKQRLSSYDYDAHLRSR